MMADFQNNNTGISIQVGLGGYSFKVSTGSQVSQSGWMTPESLFSSPQFQRRYDSVEVSVFTPKFTLIPVQFYNPSDAGSMLSEVASLSSEDVVEAVELPQFAAVLLYSNVIGGSLPRVVAEMVLKTDGSKAMPLPEMYYMLSSLDRIPEYNKVVASFVDGYLYLVLAQGRTLLLCNAFQAQDFSTAEYFIFLAMKKLQLNPEMSVIYFRTPVDEEEQMSLYRYFKSVERL